MPTTDQRPGSSDRPTEQHVRGRFATLSGERRSLEDRRKRFDRREMIRFEDDRRSINNRRADSDPWGFETE